MAISKITGSGLGTIVGNVDFNGDMDVDGTANLDIVDIDGAVNMATTALVTGVLTANGGAVFNEGSADVDFRVETNGNANMLFVDGGNNRLQIGSATSDDDQMFQLILAGGSAGFGIHSNRAAAGGSSLIMSHNRNNAVGSFTILNDADTLGRITFQGCDGGDIKTEGAQIAAEVDGTPGANDMPTRLVFSVTADGANTITERMRLSSAGHLFFSSGGTNPSGSQTGVRISGINGQNFFISANGGTSGYDQFAIFNGNGRVGSITTENSGTSFTTSSDHRLKENVVYNWDATTRLKQLKPARFNFIADGTDTVVDGFLAHEAATVVPEAVVGTHNETKTLTKVVLSSSNIVLAEDIEQSDWTAGKSATTDEDENEVAAIYPSDSTWAAEHVVPEMQGIDKGKLVPLLVKTIQELEARITALEG